MEMEHAGVLGMKWGHRKKRPLKGRRLKKAQKLEDRAQKLRSADRERQAMKIYQNRDKMSTAQLKERVARLRLEDDLYQLASKAQGRTDTRSKGRRMIQNALKSPEVRKIGLELVSIALETAISSSKDNKALSITNRLTKVAKGKK